jgi:hypothetical protein
MCCPVDSWDKFALPENMFERYSLHIAAGFWPRISETGR